MIRKSLGAADPEKKEYTRYKRFVNKYE